ncbi:MAG: metallophosphoesterase [Firmicutes bacterium]|nr:metallophosphoesterase [Bacillota bacterium]
MAKSDNKFIYLGDPQCDRISGNGLDYSAWARILKKAISACWTSQELAEPSDKLIVLGGDLVNDGDNSAEWEAFFGALKSVTAGGNFRVITATGNHRRVINYADVPEFAREIQLPANGPEGFEKDFYSYDQGCIHFQVLNSNLMGTRDKTFSKYIGEWIKRDLRDNRNPVIITVMHHPMFTVGRSRDDDYRAKVMRDNYLGLLSKNGVDFILCGHQHAYCRTDGSVDVTQIMGLSGNKFFKNLRADNMAVIIEGTPTATIFETDGTVIKMETFDEAGRVLDCLEKDVRPNKKHECSTCDKVAKCFGPMPKKPRLPGGKPELKIMGDGIDEMVISQEEMSRLPDVTQVFSRRMKNGYSEIRVTGKSLRGILEMAGVDTTNENATFALTTDLGIQHILTADDLFKGRWYGDGQEKPAQALLTSDYQLAVGQVNETEFNVRKWYVNIREIDVII